MPLCESTKLSESEQINIYNSIGELVKSEQLTSSKQKIDISHLASGLYFVRVDNKVVTFIKEE